MTSELYAKCHYMRLYTACACLLVFILASCGGSTAAQIWTDRPEFAFYGEFFNSSQNQYKVTVRFIDFPSAELGKANSNPDIVVASWLKNSSTGTYFKTLDKFFGAKKLSRSVFYPRLLAAGRIENNQYLLPVSFNIPALIFTRNREQEISNQFTIGFDEIKQLSGNFNTLNREAYTRMGFSPLWSDDFLLLTSVLFGTSFREASPLSWDPQSLEKSMDFIYNWNHEINTGNQAEEDFRFKYFYEPPEKLIQTGRILFSYLGSGDLFTLNDDSRNNLDFRWIMEDNKIPIRENSVYMGIPKKGKSAKAARAFILWFFQIDSQRKLLEYSKANRINETVFGICSGFSALTSVTEQIYPVYYPGLLGRMPPSDFLMVPNVLPSNWAVIRDKIILPYIHERARKENAQDITPLERRLSDWTRMNR